MNKHLRNVLALALALVLVLGCFPAALAADPASTAAPAGDSKTAPGADADLPLTGFHHLELPGYHRPAADRPNADESLPDYFNTAEQGWDTPVKNQAPYGTCWAFGTMAPIETYMIKHGIPVGSSGQAATTELDLSEYHLSYFAYTDAYDEYGLTAGDSSVLSESHLNIGGDGYKSTLTLMRWEGPASEELPALAYDQAGVGAAIDPQYAYAYDVAHVSDVDWIPTSDRDAVKRALMEYGSAFFGYYFNSTYNTTDSTGAYCCIQDGADDGSYKYGANHGVTLVGWDDNYSRNNFLERSRPSSDGAWIIKNSWGTTGNNAAYTKNGYNYISYEDTASFYETCMFFKAEPVDQHQHIYQYDGTLNIDDYVGLTANNSQIANVFTAQGHEKVEAVSILTLEEGLGYTLNVYKGLTDSSDPTSGTLMATQEGTIAYHGYHTINLDTPVSVNSGEKFSAVFTLHSSQPSSSLMMVLPIDATRTDEYESATLTHTHSVHENTSFFRIAGTVDSWSQPKDGAGNFRIKAYTSDDPYALTAVSEDESKGTVSVGVHTAQGWVVTAQPAEGWYASGCTVTAGSASVIQDGNTFYIEPTVDSTVTVHFARKTAVTLTYLANGETVGTASGMTGEITVLPETAPAYEGYTFLGWTPAPSANVLSQPQTFAPGGSYYPLGNDSLYALYTFDQLAVEGQDGSYVKVSSSAELTDGKYLLVNEARQLALNGALIDSEIDVLENEMAVTVNGDRIPESESVNDGAFTYTAETHSLCGKRETSTGKVYYIASPSWKNWIKYIYTTPYETPAARLTYTFAADGSVELYDTYYSSYLKYYDDGSEANFRFTKESSGIYPISMYRKTEDTTQHYFTTDIDAQAAVSYVVRFESNGGSAVTAQTVIEGYSALRPADPVKAGFVFAGWYSDPELTQAYDFSAPVTGNLILYAKWEQEAPKEYTVSFNSNGGSAVESQTVLSGQTAAEPAAPTRAGFVFVGWFVDAGLVNAFDFSTPVTGNLILYAKWEEIPSETCTVSFNSNGGSAVAAQVVENGQCAQQPADPSREGCVFDGWYQDAGLSVPYDFTSPVTGDLTLYAAWNLSLRYMVNGALSETVTVRADRALSLPETAPAFEGWSFLGWTAVSTEETASAPAYTPAGGSYTPAASAVLHALYTRSEAGGGSAYELVTENRDDWTGSYVITKGSVPAYVMAGLDSGLSYETESNGGAASFASTGIVLEDSQLKNVAPLYSFTVAPIEGTEYYSFRNTEKGSCLLIRNSTLYAGDFNSSNSRWSASIGADGVATIRNPYSSYSNCITFAGSSFWGNVFQVMSSVSDIYLWRETAAGADYYTTVIGEPVHEHTPAEAVIENELPATCTEAGSYESVVYCSVCHELLSRETVAVAALGHNPGEAVQENYVEPTATAYGGYDSVVYCTRCSAELSREHTTIPATGPAEPVLDESIVLYNSIGIGIEIQTTFGVRKSVTDRFESWYIEVSKLDEAGNVTETKRFGAGQEGAVSEGYIREAVYTDITAKEMGVRYAASFHGFAADGSETYSNTVTNTVRDYVIGELVKTDNDDATRRLAADLLNYGAAAQVYFNFDAENLVNANLSAEAQAAMEQFADVGEAPATLENGSNGPNVYGSVSVMNRVVLSLTVRGVGSPSEVKVLVKDHETGAVKATLDTVKRGSVWMADYAGFEAEDMRTAFDFVPVADGTETGTPLTWSVEGYAKQARQNEDASEAELALFNALLHYVDAAAAAYGN